MAARARKIDESFEDYRKNLIEEGARLKVRLSSLYAAAAPTSKLMQKNSKNMLRAFRKAMATVIPTNATVLNLQKCKKASRTATRLARRAQR